MGGGFLCKHILTTCLCTAPSLSCYILGSVLRSHVQMTWTKWQIGWAWPTFANQTHFHKKGKGLVNTCVLPHCTVWSNHVTIFCHMTQCLSSNDGLENGDRELGHLFCYYRSCKNTSTIYLIEVRTLQQVFQECFIVASSSCIVVGHQTFLAFSEHQIFSLFFFVWKWVWLAVVKQLVALDSRHT